MQYIAAGLSLGFAAALFQQSQATVDWTPIVIAFLTGAFGSNGISKIIDSVWNAKNIGKVRAQLEESKELYKQATEREHSCKQRITELKHAMNQQHQQHQAEIAKLRRDLRGRL